MLNVPNLDDQRFEETLEAAIARIPHLYPEWTDFNEHDPGITILELFCWYKQMQQYHLNQITDRNLEEMYKLLGIERKSIEPSYIVAAVDDPIKVGSYPMGTRLISDAGVTFELNAPVKNTGYSVCALFSVRRDGEYDITGIINNDGMDFPVFGEQTRGAHDSLLIGLEGERDISDISLWISVSDRLLKPRNPFDGECEDPRRIAYTAICGDGERKMTVVSDGTRSLSQSGMLRLKVSGGIPETDAGCGLKRLRWIKLVLEDAGCEEMPFISCVFAGYLFAEQRKTLSEQKRFSVNSGRAKLRISTRLAIEGISDVLLRDKDGWYSVEFTSQLTQHDGVAEREYTLNVPAAVTDGGDNVMIICCDPEYKRYMKRDLSALPGERLQLPQEDGKPLSSSVTILFSEHVSADKLRYKEWKYIDELYKADGSMRVFSIDDETDELVMGDDMNGRVPDGGKNAVYIASLAYTDGAEGGANTNTVVFFDNDDEKIRAGRVMRYTSGRDKMTMDEMEESLKSRIEGSVKAVTAEDYETIALDTPGVRIAQARALPMFDPKNKRRGKGSPANVTMVVLPASADAFPQPDDRFLEAVQRQMEKYRTICTCMHTIGPTYTGITVWAEMAVRGDESRVEREVRGAIERYFDFSKSMNRLGSPVNKNEITAAVGTCGSVLAILNLELRATGTGCRKNEQGDISIPQYAIAYLSGLEIHVTQS